MGIKFILIFLFSTIIFGADDGKFIIKKPGEITFTSGVVIEGRVEKPQVMLVITKDDLKISPIEFSNSFLGKMTKPLRNNTFEGYQIQKKKKK